MKNEFKQYKRKSISEMRIVNQDDIDCHKINGFITVHETKDNFITVSISDADLKNGSPKIGDMIARNPKNWLDQWLVDENYFNDNLEEI